MIRILKSLKLALNWNAALSLTSDRKYDDALKRLEKNEELDNKVPTQALLLKAFLLLKLDKDEIAGVNIKRFLKEIIEDDRYNHNDKQYLVAFASWIILSLPQEHANQFTNFKIYRSIGDISQVSLGGVKKSLKRIFPLEIHNRWEFHTEAPKRE